MKNRMWKASEVKLQIKAVQNKDTSELLFAEAGSDFTDVLLSFLLLPLGTIVNILKKHYGDDAPVIGSLNTLYNGVENLGSIHFSESCNKSVLTPINPYVKELCKLRLNVSSTKPTVSDCGNTYAGVLTDGAASFVITDDLQVMPIAGGSSIITTLSKLRIAVTDMDRAKTKSMTFGLNEIMALLKESLVSQNPVSALLFHGSQTNSATLNYEVGNTSLPQIVETASSINTKKMSLKVVIQKSTEKLLFAQADHEFISFLFSLLTLPLGRVEWYLGSETGLTSMDNLHKSVAGKFNDKLMASKSARDSLIKPRLYEFMYLQEFSNDFYPLNFDPNVARVHVKESRMYMVSDNLNVTPLDVTSSISVLNGMKVPLSDIEEQKLQVGLEEGLSILKAALTSTTALTDGLINPMLKKQSKQENVVNKEKQGISQGDTSSIKGKEISLGSDNAGVSGTKEHVG